MQWTYGQRPESAGSSDKLVEIRSVVPCPRCESGLRVRDGFEVIQADARGAGASRVPVDGERNPGHRQKENQRS